MFMKTINVCFLRMYLSTNSMTEDEIIMITNSSDYYKNCIVIMVPIITPIYSEVM